MFEYDDLNFVTRNDMPDTISGLILVTTVYLNNQLSEKEPVATTRKKSVIIKLPQILI